MCPSTSPGRAKIVFSSPDTDLSIRDLTVSPDYAMRVNWEVDPRFHTLDMPGETPVGELEELRLDIEMDAADHAAVADEIAELQQEIDRRFLRIAGASIIGRNQLGEITVQWANGEPVSLIHAVWWRDLRVADEAAIGDASPLVPWTVATVSLAFDAMERPFQ